MDKFEPHLKLIHSAVQNHRILSLTDQTRITITSHQPVTTFNCYICKGTCWSILTNGEVYLPPRQSWIPYFGTIRFHSTEFEDLNTGKSLCCEIRGTPKDPKYLINTFLDPEPQFLYFSPRKDDYFQKARLKKSSKTFHIVGYTFHQFLVYRKGYFTVNEKDIHWVFS